jgi:Fur family ferric uptake transcriptional regulator
MTRVRRVICEVIDRQPGPVEAERVLREAREIDGLISASSVYRTLASLAEGGFLAGVKGTEDRQVYMRTDPEGKGSGHIVCLDCGKMLPLSGPLLDADRVRQLQQAGFRPEQIQIRVEARCGCSRRNGGNGG